MPSFLKKGFVPIILAAIVSGTVLVIGGNGAGLAYWQSNKMIELGKNKTADDKFIEAKNAYGKAAKWWPSKYRKGLAEKAAKVVINENNYHDAISAVESGDYAACITTLETISADFPKYSYVTSVLSQCRDNKNKVDQGQETVAVAIGDPAVATNTTAGKTAKSTKSSSTNSAAGTQSGNTNNQSSGDASNQTDSVNSTSENSASTSTAQPNSSGQSQAATIPETSGSTPPPPVTSPAIEPITGYYSTTSVESIVSSLQLVYDDALGDYITPYGGADPVNGAYEYAPIDVDNFYVGIHDGRIYFKATLGGTIAASQETIGDNTIESITFNIGVDSDGDLMEACATEADFQARIGYDSNGQIGYSIRYNANCTGGDMGTHSAVYEKSGYGTAHIYNSGAGKDSIVVSYALSDLADMIHVGDNLNIYIASEAESSLWEHYSNDYNESFGEPLWSAWTAAEV